MTRRMSLAVIIPTLNESLNLRGCLESVHRQTRQPDEVIVVDGQSTDETTTIAEGFGAAVLVARERGRGLQIRAGLDATKASIAVVLHADMIVPAGAFASIDQWLAEHDDCPGGCLGHRFDRRGWLLRAIEIFDRIRAERFGVSYGDQAQFFRPERLAVVGGFPHQPIMEDLEVSLRLKKLGKPAYLDLPAIVSARRFDRLGVLRTVLANLRYRLRYRLGGLAACESIYRQYHGRDGGERSSSAAERTVA